MLGAVAKNLSERQFTVDVESGKPTVQFDRVMRLLDELGIHLSVDIPEEASATLAVLQENRSQRTERHSAPTEGKNEDADA